MIWAIVLSFLSGSIPFGYVIAKLKGVDIRKIGSGNIGATNVGRALGRKYFFLVLLLDALKGFLPTLVFTKLYGLDVGVFCALASVLGHSFTPWLGFRGGKGVATGFGAFLALTPLGIFVGFLVWLTVLLVFRIMALASMLGALAVFITVLFISDSTLLKVFAGLTALLIVVRHRHNISRMIKGEEPKFNLFR